MYIALLTPPLGLSHKMVGTLFIVCTYTVLLSVGSLSESDRNWTNIRRAYGWEEIEVTFAISQYNPHWLETKFMTVSYPDSPDYGNYMNFDEIAANVYGRHESIQALLDTLKTFGISRGSVDFTLGRDFAVVMMSVKAGEQLFSCKFYYYQHSRVKHMNTLKASKWTLPKSLEGHVDFISGVGDFPHPNHISSRISLTADDDTEVTPAKIKEIYRIYDQTTCSSRNSQATASFMGQFFSQKDLDSFDNFFNLSSPRVVIVGFNNMSDPGLEAQLDVQYITSVASNATTWFISFPKPAKGGHEDFLSYIISQVNNTDSPWTHSISYGDVESSLEHSFIMRTELEFKKFGISGRSLLVSSGDSGVYCLDGSLTPYWPASSPSVTSVGGTMPDNDVVWPGSGGGFSSLFSVPTYQQSSLEKYMRSVQLPSLASYNPNFLTRGYPDVTGFAKNCVTMCWGEKALVDGTSCAAPIVTGILF